MTDARADDIPGNLWHDERAVIDCTPAPRPGRARTRSAVYQTGGPLLSKFTVTYRDASLRVPWNALTE